MRLSSFAAWLIPVMVIAVDVLDPAPRAAAPSGKQNTRKSPGRVEFQISTTPKAAIFLDGDYLGTGTVFLEATCDPLSGTYLGVVGRKNSQQGLLELVLGSEKAFYILSRKDLKLSCAAWSYRKDRHTLLFNFRNGEVTETRRKTGAARATPLSYGNPRAREE